MSLSDTAEYWWDVKSHHLYTGRHFLHNPNHKCSHYNPSSGNIATTIYIDDINCFECLENIKNGLASTEGLKEGKAPETFYMTKKGKKAYNKQKAIDDKYGKCSCGCSWVIRINNRNKSEFLGCSNYPTCKNTKSKL